MRFITGNSTPRLWLYILAALVGTGMSLVRPLSAAQAACNSTNLGHLCSELQVCVGIGDNKTCNTWYYYYPK